MLHDFVILLQALHKSVDNRILLLLQLVLQLGVLIAEQGDARVAFAPLESLGRQQLLDLPNLGFQVGVAHAGLLSAGRLEQIAAIVGVVVHRLDLVVAGLGFDQLQLCLAQYLRKAAANFCVTTFSFCTWTASSGCCLRNSRQCFLMFFQFRGLFIFFSPQNVEDFNGVALPVIAILGDVGVDTGIDQLGCIFGVRQFRPDVDDVVLAADADFDDFLEKTDAVINSLEADQIGICRQVSDGHQHGSGADQFGLRVQVTGGLPNLQVVTQYLRHIAVDIHPRGGRVARRYTLKRNPCADGSDDHAQQDQPAIPPGQMQEIGFPMVLGVLGPRGVRLGHGELIGFNLDQRRHSGAST